MLVYSIFGIFSLFLTLLAVGRFIKASNQKGFVWVKTAGLLLLVAGIMNTSCVRRNGALELEVGWHHDKAHGWHDGRWDDGHDDGWHREHDRRDRDHGDRD